MLYPKKKHKKLKEHKHIDLKVKTVTQSKQTRKRKI